MTSRSDVLVRDSGLSFIEQLQKIGSFECPKATRPFLIGVNDDERLCILTRPACKCWACKPCAARNARRWIARIINHCNHADTENGWFMFTVTAHEKWRGVRSVTNLRQGWKKLYNRMRYEFGVSQYAKVWEMHEDSSFHLHGLIDAVIAERWLKDNSRECGMGYQTDIHPVDNAGQVAGYIAKYFLKSEGNVSDTRPFPKNLRRIEVSRNWTPLPDLKGDMVFTWLINQTRDGQLRTAWGYKENNYQILDFVNKPERSEGASGKVV